MTAPLEFLAALIRLTDRIRAALLAVLIGIHSTLLLVLVRILRLVLFLALILLRLLTLHVFGVLHLGILRVTIGHDRLHFEKEGRASGAVSGRGAHTSTSAGCFGSGILQDDVKGQCFRWNPAFLDTPGWSPCEALPLGDGPY